MEFIEFLSPTALAELQKANAELVTMVANVDTVGKKMKSISTPSGSDSAIKQLTAEYQKQEKTIQSLQAKLEVASQKQQANADKTRLAEIKLSQAREKAFDKYEAQLNKEQAKLTASQNLYNKVQAKLNSLSNEYKVLATQKELTGKLTDKESQRYDFLQGKIQKYDTTLKAVDATMGKYQRNVGNYASGFNSLGNSVNQLTREMPAFANSVQTGFMAISNNLPIFFDAISQTNNELKALKAQGQEVPSLFSKLGSSIFTVGTALSVGVTLLTLYGKDIVEWASSVIKGTVAVDTLKESQKQLNDINSTGQKNAVEETIKLKSLLSIAKDTSLSYKDRMIAVENLQKTYPYYFENLSKEKILAGETKKAEDELTLAILSRAKANAAIAKITENEGKIIDLELQRAEAIKKVTEAQKQLNSAKIVQSQTVGGGTVAGTYNLETTALQKLIRAQNSYKDIVQQIKDEQAINNVLTKYALENQEKAIGLDYKETSAKKEKNKVKRENVEVIKLETAQTTSLLDALNKQKEVLIQLQKETSKSRTEWVFWQKGIDDVQKSIDYLTKGTDDLATSAKNGVSEFERLYGNMAKGKDNIDEFKKATDDWIASFQSGFFSDAGLPTLFKILNGEISGFGENWKTTFLAISQVTQEALTFLSENSKAYFDGQYARLEQQKNVAIMFAGESTTAQDEINKQYDEKRRQIARKQAEEQKKMAIFNIAVNTAQAIVATLAKTPLPLGLPLIIATSAIGALQMAMVASQPLPAYAKGTDNAPEGWALTQERGAEIITDKKGKIKSYGNDKGAQMTYLSKGDKVFTAQQSEALMFNDSLNAMLMNNGIGSSVVINNDNSELVKEIQSLKDTIANKPAITIIEDERGRKIYQREQGQVKEFLNNRLEVRGYDI